jgi:hypothetical protein
MTDPQSPDPKTSKTERYVRPTVAGWLAPLMVGPWVSTYGAVSLYAAFGPDHEYVNRWVKWVVGMGFGTLYAAFFVLALAIVDVLLLSLRQRVLPTGRNAWLMATGTPLAGIASYVFMSPLKFYKYGPWAVAAAIVLPVVLSSFTVRIAAGQKISKQT